MSLQVMGNIEPGAKAVLWSETRQPIQTWTTQMKGLINSITFPGMVLDVKGTKTYGPFPSLRTIQTFAMTFIFSPFRRENLRQGPCGDHARERRAAEPTVGDRTAVKTSRTT